MRSALRWLLTIFMVGSGTTHFLSTETYVAMVPSGLPVPAALVYLSGVAEVLGGLGLIVPRTQRVAAWGLIGLFIAVFPANVNMAVNMLPLGSRPLPGWALYGRLPLQVLLVLWAFWYARPNASGDRRTAG